MNELTQRPPEVTIGENCNIDPTVRIGTQSYTLERDEEGALVRGRQHGDVVIGDNVEISPFSIVRRATMPGMATEIGDGTKISAFVNIAHNVKIGKHVFIGPTVAIDGGVEVGDFCYIAPHVQINSHVKIGEGAFIGAGAVVRKDVPPGEMVVGVPARPIWHRGNYIADDFKCGKNFRIGKQCVIEPDVVVGDNVKLGHFVTLKSGTRFGNDVKFSDYCKTTGLCYLGNNVDVRTGACISRSVIIEDCVFVGPGIMTNHTKHVAHMRPKVEKRQLITRIGYGAIVGSRASLTAGVNIGDNVILGANCGVYKDILEPGIYVGDPAKKMKDLPEEYYVEKSKGYIEYSFSTELLEKYLPDYKGDA